MDTTTIIVLGFLSVLVFGYPLVVALDMVIKGR